MPWYNSQSYHSQSVTFTSATVRAAASNWGFNVAKGLIGDLADAVGTAFEFGPAVAASNFARAAMWTVGKESVMSSVYVSSEFYHNGSDFQVNVHNKWVGPNPILMTASNRDMPADFRNAIYQKNDDGDSIVTLSDGKKLVYGRDCDLDMYGTGKSEMFETCSAADNKIVAYNGNDILKGNGGNDRLYGGDGSDMLFGGSGNDYLNGGGAGTMDHLYGGSGDDTFYFGHQNNVTVHDFQKGDHAVGFDTGQMQIWHYTRGDVAYVQVESQDQYIDFAENGGADGVWLSRDSIIDYLQ